MRITICQDNGEVWEVYTIDAVSGPHLRATLDPTFPRPSDEAGSEDAHMLVSDLITMCRNLATEEHVAKELASLDF